MANTGLAALIAASKSNRPETNSLAPTTLVESTAADEPSPVKAAVDTPKNPFASKVVANESQKEQVQEQQAQADDAKPAPRLAGFAFGKKPQQESAVIDVARADGQGFDSLDGLANLDVGQIPEVGPTPSRFADETPATAPTRDLPSDLDGQQQAFVQLIDGVYGMLYDPELTGSVIKSIMLELKSNPQYIKLIAPEDARTWVRAMRDSMGLARIKKTEAKAKRSGGARAGGSRSVDSDMLADLTDLGLA